VTFVSVWLIFNIFDLTMEYHVKNVIIICFLLQKCAYEFVVVAKNEHLSLNQCCV